LSTCRAEPRAARAAPSFIGWKFDAEQQVTPPAQYATTRSAISLHAPTTAGGIEDLSSSTVAQTSLPSDARPGIPGLR
jgi:hypothetical protein